MMYLFLSIGLSSMLYVIFKYFQKTGVHTLHAIVVNYLVAGATGILVSGNGFHPTDMILQDWFMGCIILGFLFITIFNLMALTSQYNGLSVAAVAGKMSLVIPVIAGLWLYNESLGWMKIIGILIALAGVYFTSLRDSSSIQIEKKYVYLPVILFFGSGLIDTVLKYFETTYLNASNDSLFSTGCFGVAFILGIIALTYSVLIKGERFTGRSLIGGIVLGIPNFFSIYYLIKALRSFEDSAVAYTFNHIGTILFTTILGIVIFKERMIPKNYLGVGLALIAIVLIAFAKA